MRPALAKPAQPGRRVLESDGWSGGPAQRRTDLFWRICRSQAKDEISGTRRLNAGVPAVYVAEWAGHSVAVLQRIYAHCLDGQDDHWFKRMDAALGR